MARTTSTSFEQFVRVRPSREIGDTAGGEHRAGIDWN
jgi:hypothetical protein